MVFGAGGILEQSQNLTRLLRFQISGYQLSSSTWVRLKSQRLCEVQNCLSRLPVVQERFPYSPLPCGIRSKEFDRLLHLATRFLQMTAGQLGLNQMKSHICPFWSQVTGSTQIRQSFFGTVQ